MPDRSVVGKTYPPFTVRVEHGKVREYAEAIRDDNPLYRDEEAARRSPFGGIIAPPTFARNFWWEGTAVQDDLGFDPRYRIHGEQEFEYHQPIKAGDVLTGQIRVVDVYEKAGKRGGKMTFGVIETTYRNARGETALVARRTIIETTPQPEAPREPSPPVRPLDPGEAREGLESPPLVVGPVTRTDFVRFAGASGDMNPNHHDEVYAIRSGNERVFAMGMLQAGYLGRLLTDWLGDGALRRFRIRFAARVHPGDVLTCKARLTQVRRDGGGTQVECDAWVDNQEGQKVIVGSAAAELRGSRP